MKRFFSKSVRVIKKLLDGQDITKVKYSTEEWDKEFAGGQWNYLLNTQYNVVTIAAMIKDVVAKRGRIKLLDIGCGNGALAQAIAGLGVNYTGLDISQVALDEAAKIMPQGTFKLASMDEDPELEGVFDVIVFSEVLLYGDYEKTLSIHQKYLAPEHIVIISLYQTWRTRIIWLRIRKQLKTIKHVNVKDKLRGIAWDVRLGTLSAKSL